MDPLEFRTLMRRVATGVAMVTSSDGSTSGGVTVNAFTALSLSPPQMLVCLDNGSRTLGRILSAGSFAVNVLGAGQQELARRFADKSLTAAERFAHVPTRPLQSGAPAIPGAIAVLDCRLVQTWCSGDHTVLVGEVVDGSADGFSDPLIFHAGGYRRLAARRDNAAFALGSKGATSATHPRRLRVQGKPGDRAPGQGRFVGLNVRSAPQRPCSDNHHGHAGDPSDRIVRTSRS